VSEAALGEDSLGRGGCLFLSFILSQNEYRLFSKKVRNGLILNQSGNTLSLKSAQVVETKRDTKVHFAQFAQRVSEEAEEVRDEQNASGQGRNDGRGGREMESKYPKI
jgi:hypothetical protein